MLNPGLAKLARALCNVHPELLSQVTLSEQDLSKSCVDIVERWQAGLKSFMPNDSLAVHPEVTGYSSSTRNSPQFGGDNLRLELFLTCPEPLYMKQFMKRCRNNVLAHDAAKAIEQVAYLGLEIWTPEVIRDMYGSMNWSHSDSDADILEEYAMNQWEGEGEEVPTLKPEDLPFALPSKWDADMTKLGYKKLGPKPIASIQLLRDLAKGRSQKDAELAMAILKLREIIKRGHVRYSDEGDRWGCIEASFVFLWDDDSAQLRHALDEAVNDRYEAGVSRENVLEVTVRPEDALQEVEQYVRAVEHLLAMQVAVGNLYTAMTKFVT